MTRKHNCIFLMLGISFIFTRLLTAQTTVNFEVDSSQSTFRFTMASTVNSTFSDTDNDTVHIKGDMQVDFLPSFSPFDKINIKNMNLRLAEELFMENQLGSLGGFEVTVQRDSLSLILTKADSIATVIAGSFEQPGNTLSMTGAYNLSGQGLIALVSDLLNSKLNEEFGSVMFTEVDLGGMIVQENSNFRLDVPVMFSAMSDFNESGISGDIEFSLEGTVVANGMVTTSVDQGESALPQAFVLQQSYPNPFNSSCIISYSLPAASRVVLTIYDLMGREVKKLVEAARPAGAMSLVWDGNNDRGAPLASGVYVVKMTAGEFAAAQKVMLIR